MLLDKDIYHSCKPLQQQNSSLIIHRFRRIIAAANRAIKRHNKRDHAVNPLGGLISLKPCPNGTTVKPMPSRFCTI